MQNSLIDSCEHPVRIKDKRKGGYIFVPCGHCIACRHKYQLMWRERLEAESKQSVSVLFFTLTYDNEHVPMACLDRELGILSVNRDVPNVDVNEYRLSSQDLSFDSFPKLCINHNSSEYVKDVFPVVCKSDVQAFIKRLRRRISYDSANLLSDVSVLDKSIRYFIAAEYGPNTFRPHYHGLLFFKSKRVSKAVAERYFYESWHLCDRRNLDCSEVFSCASSYVSKYVTVDSRLPRILQIAPFCTFSLRSSRPSIGSAVMSFDDLVDKVKCHSLTYDKVTVSQTGILQTVQLPIRKAVIGQFFKPLYREYSYSRDEYLRFFGSYLKYCSDGTLRSFSEISYKSISSVIPNLYKEVDSRLTPDLVTGDSLTIGDLYDCLSYEEICFGIRQNRSAIIHYILCHLLYGVSLIDYVDLYLDLKTIRFSMSYANFVDSYNNSVDKVNHPFDLLYWSYPSLFAELPRSDKYLSHSDVVSLNLRLGQIGYDLSEFYDSNGMLIKYNIPRYQTTSEYVSYLDSLKDSLKLFDKSRKLAQADSLGYNIYSPI